MLYLTFIHVSIPLYTIILFYIVSGSMQHTLVQFHTAFGCIACCLWLLFMLCFSLAVSTAPSTPATIPGAKKKKVRGTTEWEGKINSFSLPLPFLPPSSLPPSLSLYIYIYVSLSLSLSLFLSLSYVSPKKSIPCYFTSRY